MFSYLNFEILRSLSRKLSDVTITGVCRLWVTALCAEKFPNNTTQPGETSLFHFCAHTRDSTAVNRHTLHWDTKCTAHGHSALHWDIQCIALGHAVHCTESHSALHWDTQYSVLRHTVHCTETHSALQLHWTYSVLEGTVAYGPLLLAPAEGLGGSSGPLTCGGNLF